MTMRRLGWVLALMLTNGCGEMPGPTDETNSELLRVEEAELGGRCENIGYCKRHYCDECKAWGESHGWSSPCKSPEWAPPTCD